MNLEPVWALLRERTGLEAANLGAASAHRATLARMQKLSLDPVSYAERLRRDPGELIALVDDLVVPETWFFRGGALFEDLASRVKLTLRARPGRGVFRALSLPCSTGEEPYSFSLALAESGQADAAVHLHGADISPRALAQARRGIYSEFSFRQIPTGIRERYFRPTPSGWELDSAIRARVTFFECNLLDPGLLLAGPPYDLVICRNLFIYLGPDARRQALTNLTRLLTVDGLLCMGHAEALDASDPRFVPEGRSEYFLYKRAEKGFSPPATLLPPIVPPIPSPTVSPVANTSLSHAKTLADAGRYHEALMECKRLLEGVANADIFALLGVIQQALHQPDEARLNLEKALYLDPNHHDALVHLHLAAQQRGDEVTATALRRRLERLS